MNMRLMTAEWTAGLSRYGFERLSAAVSEHIRTSRYWPTIADILAQLQAGHMAPGLPRYRSIDPPFERAGRTAAEEMAFRAAQVLQWRAEAAAVWSPGETEPAATPVVRPASQAAVVSSALANSCAARRGRGLPTCSADCCKQECRLKSDLGDH